MRCMDCIYCINMPNEFDGILTNNTCALHDFATDYSFDACDDIELDNGNLCDEGHW